MRVLKLIPEVEHKLETGELNLTTIGLAQTFFRAEVKSGKVLTIQDKKDVFKKIENKSTNEAIKEFIKISPSSMTQDKRRDLTETHSELKVIVPAELLEKLDKVKALLSNKHPHLKDSELLEIMADMCLEKLDPIKKEKPNKSTSPREVKLSKNPRYIPSAMKQEVWFKDKGCCSFLNPHTKEKCNSRHFLEVDHIKPIALNGKTELNNLRLVCRAHNVRNAISAFGFSKMNLYINN